MNNGETGLAFNGATNELSWYYGGCRPLTLNDDGGTLHGHWGTYSLDVTSSDRRLKENIRPVLETLQHRHAAMLGEQAPALSGGSGQELDEVMQMLQPVSYNLRSEGNSVRFGFVADEMFKVLPEVTRVQSNRDSTMGILYHDLLAILIARMQDMFEEMDNLNGRLAGIERRTRQRRAWRTRRN